MNITNYGKDKTDSTILRLVNITGSIITVKFCQLENYLSQLRLLLSTEVDDRQDGRYFNKGGIHATMFSK